MIDFLGPEVSVGVPVFQFFLLLFICFISCTASLRMGSKGFSAEAAAAAVTVRDEFPGASADG